MADLAQYQIRKLDQIGHIEVWEVDGAKIRESLDIEFSGFAQHTDKKYVPRNQFWLEKESHPDEQRFFVDHMLAQYKALKRGKSREEALDIAYAVEISERKKSGDLRKVVDRNNRPNPAEVHQRLLGKTDNGLSVWLVNGRLVRSTFFIDFIEGGHHVVYPWVPDNEIWLDDDLPESELPYVLLHELNERNLMAKGETYATAHPKSSKIELHCHHHPDDLPKELAKLGWHKA